VGERVRGMGGCTRIVILRVGALEEINITETGQCQATLGSDGRVDLFDPDESQDRGSSSSKSSGSGHFGHVRYVYVLRGGGRGMS